MVWSAFQSCLVKGRGSGTFTHNAHLTAVEVVPSIPLAFPMACCVHPKHTGPLQRGRCWSMEAVGTCRTVHRAAGCPLGWVEWALMLARQLRRRRKKGRGCRTNRTSDIH